MTKKQTQPVFFRCRFCGWEHYTFEPRLVLDHIKKHEEENKVIEIKAEKGDI